MGHPICRPCRDSRVL